MTSHHGGDARSPKCSRRPHATRAVSFGGDT
jgi:hypothetical protein